VVGKHVGKRLQGRRVECAALDEVLDGARTGHSAVLVVRGAPGVGKTVLLDYVADRASGCQVARASGVESEMELAFSGLQQLLGSSMLERAERLPPPQRDALRLAFGLAEGSAPDRFLVGLATLSLFSDVADEWPLVCLVDDAQWLDRASAQILSFVARRLAAERIAMVFAVQEPSAEQELDGMPQLVVEGLDDHDARLLLASGIPGGLDEQVRDRIVAETRGNPMALLELPGALTPAELAGGFGVPDSRALVGRIEQNLLRRVQSLPTETQRLLLVAAAEASGDAALVFRAAEGLGIGAEALAPAEAAGLIELGPGVRFHHPLVRSASYRAASPGERRHAHASRGSSSARQHARTRAVVWRRQPRSSSGRPS
jgi:AAA ATPase domain